MGYPRCNITREFELYGGRNATPGQGAGFPQCTYCRPQQVYNAATGLYVIWVNLATGCQETCSGASCPS